MASTQNNPPKKNPSQDQEGHPESQARQQEQQQAPRHQPGQQDHENANKASDAQLNQGGTGQGQHGSARGNRPERDENMEPTETSSGQPGRSSN